MKTVSFEGASDDLIEVEGCDGGDEYGVWNNGDSYKGTFTLVEGNEPRMNVHAFYDGCWSFGIGMVDEDVALPDWPTRLKSPGGRGYTTRLEIDIPDNVFVKRDHPNE